jgi:hypothetical protein
MQNETSKKRRVHHVDRICLDSESLSIVSDWTKKVSENLKGVRFSRSDLVNEIIKRRSRELSSSELKAIVDAHYDPAKALIWAANEVRLAQKSGTAFELSELVKTLTKSSQKQPSTSQNRPKRRPQGSTKTSDGMLPKNSELPSETGTKSSSFL